MRAWFCRLLDAKKVRLKNTREVMPKVIHEVIKGLDMKQLHVSLITILLAITMVGAGVAHAFNNDPNAPFDALRARIDKTTITWRKVDDIQAACEKESQRRGLGGFGYGVEACSFWDKSFGFDQCTIITKKQTTMGTVGHEIRHCFAGSWH